MNYAIIKKSTFDEAYKLSSNNVNSTLYKELEETKRTLEVMNIDNITKLIGNDGVEIIGLVKKIGADGKITFGDTDELWKFAMYLIKIAGKLKDLKGELTDLTIEEIEMIVIEIIELYQNVSDEKAQKFIGPLKKPL